MIKYADLLGSRIGKGTMKCRMTSTPGQRTDSDCTQPKIGLMSRPIACTPQQPAKKRNPAKAENAKIFAQVMKVPSPGLQLHGSFATLTGAHAIHKSNRMRREGFPSHHPDCGMQHKISLTFHLTGFVELVFSKGCLQNIRAKHLTPKIKHQNLYKSE